MKIGAHTVYEENYRFSFGKDDDKPGPIQTGQAFCVVEGKYVLFGMLQSVQKVLERDKKPVFSARVEAGLKKTGLANTLTVVLDLDGLLERERAFMLKDLGHQFPGLETVAGGMQTFALRINAADKVKVLASLTCKNAESAGDLKKVGDAGLVLFKGLLKDNPQDSPEIQKAKKEVGMALSAVQLTAKDAQVHAEISLDAATAVSAVHSLFEVQTKKKKVETGK